MRSIAVISVAAALFSVPGTIGAAPTPVPGGANQVNSV
jgi:uncharacterized membrane protein